MNGPLRKSAAGQKVKSNKDLYTNTFSISL